MILENALLSKKRLLTLFVVLSCTPPSPKKEEEICQDVNSDYQWNKLCVHLLLLLLLSIFQFPTRQSEILSIRIYKKKPNISFLLKGELTAHLIATQAVTPVLWRPERDCHVHDQIGRLWAALSVHSTTGMPWLVQQTFHHSSESPQKVSSLRYCYTLYLNYQPQPSVLPGL